MRSLIRTVLTGAAFAAVSSASPLWATANTFYFGTNYYSTSTPNAASVTADGGAMGFNGKCSDCTVAPAGNFLTASITAWNANALDQRATTPSKSDYAITQAVLGMWSGGLGVISDFDSYSGCSSSAAGACGMHQIDNVGNSSGSKSYDFVQIVFNKAVTLSAISRVAYGQEKGSTTVYDDDFSFGRGSSASDMGSLTKVASNVLTATDNAKNKTGAVFTNMLATTNNKLSPTGGCTQQSALGGLCFDQSSTMDGVTADQSHASTVWWISAALLNPDNVSDAFKLYDFSVIYNDAPITPGAVPEPASWTMMIGGFGLIGAALRRKKAQERLAAA